MRGRQGKKILMTELAEEGMRSFRELAVGIPMHYTQKRVVPEAGVARLKPRRSTPSPLAASSLPDALLFVGGGSGSTPAMSTRLQ